MELLENDATNLYEDTIKSIIMTISDLTLFYPNIASTDIPRM